MTTFDALDNPIWESLTSTHANMARSNGSARRYAGRVSPLAAVSEPTPAAFSDLAALVESQGDKQHAADLYLEAIDLFTKAGAKDYVKDTYTALSKLKLKQRDVVGAMTAFDSGLEQLDKPNLIERMARKIIGGGGVPSNAAAEEEKDDDKKEGTS